MNIFTVRHGCKINLYLRVLQRLGTGYHLLHSYMLPLSEPADTLHIEVIEKQDKGKNKNTTSGLSLSCPHLKSLGDKTSLHKAYEGYAQLIPSLPFLRVTLEKNIPMGAGLGGGSANAAALLLFLQNYLKKNKQPHPTIAQLHALALSVGSDVPFFIFNRGAQVGGCGEQLTIQEHPYQGYHLLLICPPINISTTWAFQELAKNRIKKKFIIKNDLTSLTEKAISSFARDEQLQNDFEELVFHKYSELGLLKELLLEEGAEQAVMSGTGSSIFGLYKFQKDATRTQRFVEKKYLTYLQTV